MDPRENIVSLATGLATGHWLDWSVAETKAGDEAERTLVQSLRRLVTLAPSDSTTEWVDPPSEIFLRALELRPDERSRFLDNACAGNDALRQELDSLLRAFPDARAAFEAPVDVQSVLRAARVEPGTHAHTMPDGGQALSGRVGRYEIEEQIGQGGMGVVYRARDTLFERTVALKTLPPHLVDEPAARARFEREARLLAALDHPNIARIYTLEFEDGVYFLTMERIEGTSLSNLDPRPDIDGALRIGREIAAALESAHRRGIVHRDLKPGNVMVTTAGETKVLDFGIARTMDARTATDPNVPAVGAHEVSQPGDDLPDTEPSDVSIVAGTPGYMSPEQIRGRGIDARSDIFSFGCLLLHLLSGRSAFAGSTSKERIAATLEGRPNLQAIDSLVPGRLVRLVESCLRSDPEERPQSIREVRRELDELIETRGLERWIGSRVEGTPDPDPQTQGGVETNPGNLEHFYDRFIGRAEERMEIHRLLDESRSLSLIGVGGSGKSRLALQAASEREARYPDGVFRVDLAAVIETDRVLDAVLETLECPVGRGERALDALVARLRGTRSLIVLDNGDTVRRALGELLETLEERLPSAQWIYTGRLPLEIEGERRVLVSGLRRFRGAEEDDAAEHDAWGADRESDDATSLFLDRIAASGGPIDLSPSDRSRIARACARLDGLPLAIELAAARVRAATDGHEVHEFRAALDSLLVDSVAVLSGGDPTAAENASGMDRRDGLEDGAGEGNVLLRTLGTSYAELEPETRRLFRNLSVFRSGFTQRAMEQVCANPGEETWELSTHLRRLVSLALVERDIVTSRAIDEPRFRMPELVRTFASSLLAESGDADRVQERHRAYYHELATALCGRIARGGERIPLRQLREEHQNVLHALSTCSHSIDGERGLELVRAFFHFWQAAGLWDEIRREATRALTHPHVVTPPSLAQGEVLHVDASAAIQLGQMDDARRRLAGAKAIAQRLGSTHLLAKCLEGEGTIAFMLGDYDTARSRTEEATAHFARLGMPRALAVSLLNLAEIEADAGNLEAQERHATRGLELARSEDAGVVAGRCLLILGMVATSQGDHGLAASRNLEALTLFRRIGDAVGECAALGNLGMTAGYVGEFAEAESRARESVALARKMGRWNQVGIGLSNIGCARYGVGDYEGSRLSHEEAPGMFERIELLRGQRITRENLGDVCHRLGDLQAAWSHYVTALELYGDHDPATVGQILIELGSIAGAGGDWSCGAKLIGVGTDLHARIGHARATELDAQLEDAIARGREALGSGVWESECARWSGLEEHDVTARVRGLPAPFAL